VDAQELLRLADDELILGWRDSEWTGIAPFLEEDVAFSSIAQTEIGHARAWYQLAAAELATDADCLAFDREPDEYENAAFVELRLVDDWAASIARRWLYELADSIRVAALAESDRKDVAGLAEKIRREEDYHRLHAEMWQERLAAEPRFAAALERLWPYALGVLDEEQRPELCELAGREPVPAIGRGEHTDELRPLWAEMTAVRRSLPGATW
jgi:ring-1,2-phenylacetyl-CoA epoxidase subunit PaaC